MRNLTCPTCGRRVQYTDRSEVPDWPFCCERCRLVDLGKWFSEEYRIDTPTDAPPPPPESPSQKPDG